jgi:hypothetical protein
VFQADYEYTNFIFNNSFSENRTVCEIMWKKTWKSRTVHSSQYNLEHAQCMLHDCGYRHTLGMCYTVAFSQQYRLSERTLICRRYKDCLSCYMLLYAFFWVIHRRLNFMCLRYGTLCLFHLHRRVVMKYTYPPMKMEQTECSEMLAFKLQTSVNHPEESHTTFRTRRNFDIKNC